MEPRRARTQEVLDVGCAAYVVASEAREDLLPAVLPALAGETFTSPAVGAGPRPRS